MTVDQLLYDLIYDFRGTTEIDTTEGEAMIRAVMYLHGKGYVRIVKTGVPVHFKYVRRPEDHEHLYDTDGGRCTVCGKTLTETLRRGS